MNDGLEKILVSLVSAVVGFAGGFFGDLAKRVIPGYSDLVAERQSLIKSYRDLEKEMDDLRQYAIGLEDALRDQREEDQKEGRRR